jgi:DNA-binding NarL/FixJ family response regulator
VALAHSDQAQALRGYVNLSDALEGHGKHQEAVEVARAGTELSRQVGQYRTYGVYLVGNQAESLVRLGEWAEAERLLREGLSSGVSGVFAATLEDLLSYLAVHKGAGEEALAHVGQARRHLGDTAEPQFTHSLAFVEADVARARGDLQAAAGVATAGLSDTTFWSARYGWPLVWLVARIDADLATLARDRNTTPPDPVTARLRLPTAASGSSPATAGFQAMAAAEELRRAGRPGVAGWEETVQAWEVAGHAWALAYARYRLAEALCADGRRVEAVAPLRAAAASAAHLGAAPLQDDVMALARRARLSLADEETAPEAATEASTSFGLTEREREVLGLVSAGRSNGQIASALFISPKTASVHVSNILAKLGVSGRVEAAGVAHRLGLVQLPPV